MTIHDELSKPFAVGELKFFPVAKSRDGKTAKVGTYIDARAVMDRLDAVVPGQWKTSYRCIDPSDKAVECTLSIFYEGQWCERADVGYPNEAKDADNPDKEPWKAAYSDALKRAAVQFGIGRYIYSIQLERDWLPIDQYGKFTEQPRLKGATQQAASNGSGKIARSEADQTAPAATPTRKPTWWEWCDSMGYSRDWVLAISQQNFDNREPHQLGTEQRKRLVVLMEEAKKKEAAGVGA